jgi:crossover junction endodeoxyribonuclease RusA
MADKSSDVYREAVTVRLEFYFTRPKSHYRTGRHSHLLKPSAPEHPITKGQDVDKLARAVLDALTTIVYHDDRQVVILASVKDYGPSEGCHIVVNKRGGNGGNQSQ